MAVLAFVGGWLVGVLSLAFYLRLLCLDVAGWWHRGVRR